MIKLIDLALKDLTRYFRSLFAIGMMFLAPLMLTGLIYVAFGGFSSGEVETPLTRLVVVDLDHPPQDLPAFGQTLVDMFHDESVSAWLQATQLNDEYEARQMVIDRQADVAVIIPDGFTQAMIGGGDQDDVDVLIIQDPTLTIGPVVIKNMVASLLDGARGGQVAIYTTTERRQSLGVEPAFPPGFLQVYQDWYIDFQRTLYHSPDAALVARSPNISGSAEKTTGSGMSEILAMVLAGQMIFFAFFTGAYSMMTILQEDEEGTLARLFTTPTQRSLILGGKFLAVLLMVVVQAGVMLVVGVLVFKVDWGQPASVAMAVLGQVIAATGLGVLLISFTKTAQQAGPVLGGGLTAMGMLGGLFTVGFTDLPAVLNTTALFTPHGWVLKGWKVCLSGAGPSDLIVPVLVILAMGVAMFVAGALIFRRRFA